METLLKIARVASVIMAAVGICVLLVVALVLNAKLLLAIPFGGALTIAIVGGPLLYAAKLLANDELREKLKCGIMIFTVACSLNTMLSTVYYNTVALVADKELSQAWETFTRDGSGAVMCDYEEDYFSRCKGGVLAQRDRILAERNVLFLIRWEDRDYHKTSFGLAFQYWL